MKGELGTMIIVGKTNLDARDLHIVTVYGEPAEVKVQRRLRTGRLAENTTHAKQ